VATGGVEGRRPKRNPWIATFVYSLSPRRGEGIFSIDEGTEMSGTYSQILLHVAFSTKHREPWITTDFAERLYAYIGGIVRAEKGALYDIGGVEDHVHTYLRWRADESVSDLMRTVKARSSLWVHQTFQKLSAFAWQEGYSVFLVSKSQEEAVKKYIAVQADHHQKEDFKSELLRLLHAHGVEFDEQYVFD
jgi:REP element-mobilizing transposase RayT